MVAFDRNPQDFKYLRLLSRQFPTEQSAFTEIINLSAILNLPKGTEHFLTDIHGEYEAFQHVLKNASGAVKRKVNEIFGNTLRESEKKEISTLIYYPEYIHPEARRMINAQTAIAILKQQKQAAQHDGLQRSWLSKQLGKAKQLYLSVK